MGTLVDDDDSVLVVIDVQPGFLDKLESQDAVRVVECVRWLVGVARALEVPVVVTEEEPDRNGPTHPAIVAALADGHPRHLKPTFGLGFSPAILRDVASHGRGSAVLCGLETDVCVAQSAVSLIDRGWRVAVVSEAVASPGTSHEQGLTRMRGAGATVIGLKGLAYEWIRRVDRIDLLGPAGDAPAGIVL